MSPLASGSRLSLKVAAALSAAAGLLAARRIVSGRSDNPAELFAAVLVVFVGFACLFLILSELTRRNRSGRE